MRIRVLGSVILLFVVLALMMGCSSEVKHKETYETQEPTPFAVFKGEQGGPVLIHYLLPEHNDAKLTVETISSFVTLDLTQKWENLDWGGLQALVAAQFDLSRRELANGYRNNKLETKVQKVEIGNIAFSGDPVMPGYPLFRAQASAKVTIKYLRADPVWLERHGVSLNADYTFALDITLTKLWSIVRDQSLSDVISDKWRVTLARYEVAPSERPPIR